MLNITGKCNQYELLLCDETMTHAVGHAHTQANDELKLLDSFYFNRALFDLMCLIIVSPFVQW